MKIIVSDFDGVLFKKNHGIINSTVKYLVNLRYPIYVVTYRAVDQAEFIIAQLDGVVPLVGVACVGSRKKDPALKAEAIGYIQNAGYQIVEAIDNDENVVVEYQRIGITAVVTK